jgi:peroxiredoxin Q/BCP
VGVSTDTAEDAKKFRESLKAPFPFLADTDGKVSKAYGVWSDAGYAKRVTFVVGPDGNVSYVERDNITADGALGACPMGKHEKH